MTKIRYWAYIVVAGGLTLAGLACRSGGEATVVAKPTAAITPQFKIVNGAGRRDACRDVAVKIGAAPDVEDFRNAAGRLDYSQEKTTILADGAGAAFAQEVRAKLGFGEVVAADGVEGVEVVVGWDAAPAPPAGAPADGVLVSKGEKAIYFYEGGKLAYVWPCAIGKPASPTPAGDFKVTTTLEDPTWYWQGKAIPPGPENGLGKWFIGINKKGYGIHGTNEPESIGTAASHGCIRMYNEDAGALVKLVKPGTAVVIVE